MSLSFSPSSPFLTVRLSVLVIFIASSKVLEGGGGVEGGFAFMLCIAPPF